MKKFNVPITISILEDLAQNEYSFLWEIVEDFECNGHIISVQKSSQRLSVIIDGVYQRIGGNCVIYDRAGDGNIYEKPIDYVKALLQR